MRAFLMMGLSAVLVAGCATPTRVELLSENAKVREENKELRQGLLDLAKKYKAIRGPYMDPDSPVGKDK